MLSELSRELGAGPRVRQNLALVYSLAGRPQDAAALARRDFSGARLRHNLALYESCVAWTDRGSPPTWCAAAATRR